MAREHVVIRRWLFQLLCREDGSEVLPGPDRVLIHDFASEDEVVTRKSRSRHLHLLQDESDEDISPDDLLGQAGGAFAKTLNERLEKDKSKAERLPVVRIESKPQLMIRGEFMDVTRQTQEAIPERFRARREPYYGAASLAASHGDLTFAVAIALLALDSRLIYPMPIDSSSIGTVDFCYVNLIYRAGLCDAER